MPLHSQEQNGSSPALQNTAIFDKLSSATEPESNRTGNCEIQCQSWEIEGMS